MALAHPALEARLMFRPTAAYAALAAGADGDIRQAARRAARFALVLACFISFTTTGRLSIRMVVDGLACWSFVPLMNLALVSAAAGWFSRRGLAIAVEGYLAATGPWFAWLVGIAGIAVWLPPGQGELWPLTPPPLAFAGLVAAWLWSSWIQYRCLTVLWRVRPTGALVLLAGMKLVVWGVIVLFFFASDQLEPRMGSLLGG